MKRIIAYALSAVMICTALPTGVTAEGEQNPSNLLDGTETAANITVEADTENNMDISQIDTVPYTSGDIMRPDEYETLLTQMMENQEPETLASNADFLNILLKHRLVQKVGYDSLVQEMEKNQDFKAAMEWLFSDYETLQYFVYGGEPDNWVWDGRTNIATPETYLKSFKVFADIFTKYHSDIKDGETASYSYGESYDQSNDTTLDTQKLQNKALFKRLMVSIALTHSSEICMWNKLSSSNRVVFTYYPQSNPVERYELYKKLYIHNLLVADFDRYNVDELRMVVGVMIDNTQLEWMHYYYRTKFLNDENYLTAPVQAASNNVGGFCGMRYAAFNTQPACLGRGGTGDKYYAEENREQWTTKYHLEEHDSVIFNFKVPYGPVDAEGKETPEGETKEQLKKEPGKYYFAPQWTEIDAGSVCFGISNTGTVIRCAFGLPTVINEELPNHCAYFIYNHTDIDTPVTKGSGNLTLGLGYDVYGMTSSLPYFHRYAAAGWGDYPCSSIQNGIYMVYGMDAMFSRWENDDNTYSQEIMTGMSDVYLKAFNLTLAGDVWQKLQNYDKAINFYKAALKIQDYYFPAFIGLADCYEKAGKTDDEFMQLAQQAADSHMWYYAMPLSDYLINYLVPKMTNAVKKADVIFLVEEKLRDAQKLQAGCGLAQPSYSVAEANYCLSQIKKVSAFTFENQGFTIGEGYANLIGGFQYSLDNGSIWKSGTPVEDTTLIKLQEGDSQAITLESGLKYKFADSQKQGYIPFTKGTTPKSTPTQNTKDDNGDRFLNLEKGLEFRQGEEADWHDLTTADRFEGDVTVHVRRKATGTILASEEFVTQFAKSDGTPDFSFLKNDEIEKLTTTEESFDLKKDAIKKAWDGDVKTYFENMYTTAVVVENGVRKPKQNFEFTFELKEPHYIAGLKYIAGNNETAVMGLNAYASADGKSWQIAGSAENWAQNVTEKELKFTQPVYTKYIKIITTKVPTQPHPITTDMMLGHMTIAELKLYENYAVLEKTPAELTVNTGGFKNSYKLGDKPDLSGLEAKLKYTDGTESLISSGALDCDVNIFSSIETNELTLSYQGVSAKVPVTVNPNDRVATEITSITPRERKYYAGDEVDNNDIEVAVKNETESWYLLPGEFTVNGTLQEGTNDLNVTTTDQQLTKGFQIKAEKAVQSLTIEKSDGFKSQYFIGDSLDLSGMTVKLNYKEGDSRKLQEDEYTLTMTMEQAKAAEAVPEEENEDTTTVPVTKEDFGKKFGTVNMQIALKDKAEINARETLTVLPYITDGAFSFEATGPDTCTLTGYTPSTDMAGHTVTIPETAQSGNLTFTVTEIGANVFDSAPEVTAVSIPKTVKRIGANAFAACKTLTRIYMTYHESLNDFVCEEGAFVGSGTLYLNSALAVEYTGKESPIKNYTVADISASTESIKLIPPSKTNYFLNEDLDTSGMVVTAVLHDGSEVETDHYTTTYDKTRVGSQTVSVSIEGSDLTATFDVKITFPPITIVQQPVGGDYATDTAMNPLTVEATAVLNHIMYRWYKCDDENKSNASMVVEEENGTYTPTEEGYYYAEAYIKDATGQESDKVSSNVVKISVSDYTAVVDGKGYATLKEAMETAGKESTVNLYKDVVLNETITVSGGKTIILNGNNHTVTRGTTTDGKPFGAQLFVLTDEKTALTLKNITVDGGAVWDNSNIDIVLQRGTRNTGKTASWPMIDAQAQTTLNLNEGAVLQNNYNANGNQYYNASGAVNLRGATMTIDGGVIKNNYAENNASAIYLQNIDTFPASLTILKGEISGNSMGGWAYSGNSAICLVGTSTAMVTNGEFHNNKSAEVPSGHNSTVCQGGVFNVIAGNLIISGGHFYDNWVGGIGNDRSGNIGGAIGCSGGATTISGGIFERNTAKLGGAVAAKGSAAVTINGGTFNDNKAQLGGAVYYAASGGQSNISGGTFKNNTANDGSAVYVNNHATFSIGNATLDSNTTEGLGTVWTNGPLSINSPIFRNNSAAKGNEIYTDYTDYNGDGGLTIFALFDETLDIYMKVFRMITVNRDLQGKSLVIQTDSSITDETAILNLYGRDPGSWNVQGTINGRRLTEKQEVNAYNLAVKRKPFKGMELSSLADAVTEHGDTFDQGFITEAVDPSGCKSLKMIFGTGENTLTVKYPIGSLFNGALERMTGDIRFGLIIYEIPERYKGNVDIEFSEEEPNEQHEIANVLGGGLAPETETGFESETTPTEDIMIIE